MLSSTRLPTATTVVLSGLLDRSRLCGDGVIVIFGGQNGLIAIARARGCDAGDSQGCLGRSLNTVLGRVIGGWVLFHEMKGAVNAPSLIEGSCKGTWAIAIESGS